MFNGISTTLLNFFFARITVEKGMITLHSITLFFSSSQSIKNGKNTKSEWNEMSVSLEKEKSKFSVARVRNMSPVNFRNDETFLTIRQIFCFLNKTAIFISKRMKETFYTYALDELQPL